MLHCIFDKTGTVRENAKAGLGKKSLASCLLFEEINALKRQLKPEKTARSMKKTKEG
jgi:hypothetical protein